MVHSTRFLEAFDPLLFRGTCETSSRCVPITTPGAESTNNSIRILRLGPRWQRQLQPSAQRGRPGALLEMPGPSKPVIEQPSQHHQPSMLADAESIHCTPTTDLMLKIPPTTAADSPPSVLTDAAPLDTKKRSHFRRDIWLALTALTALVLLTVVALRTRTKPANSGAAATVDRAPVSTPAVVTPRNGASEQSIVPANSDALHAESTPVQVAEGAGQSTAGQITHKVQTIDGGRQEIESPNPATNPVRAKAVTHGNSAVDLANDYLRSEGVPRGCAKAMPLLNTAATKGNVRARNRLASMYATGSCVPRDPVRAYRWLSATLAIDSHNEWAQQNRDLMWRQMTAEQRSQVKHTE